MNSLTLKQAVSRLVAPVAVFGAVGIAVSLHAAPVYSDNVLASNPVAYFRLNETSGSSAANAVISSTTTGSYGIRGSGSYTLGSTNAIRPPTYGGLDAGNVAVSLAGDVGGESRNAGYLATSSVASVTDYTMEFWLNNTRGAQDTLITFVAGTTDGAKWESLGIMGSVIPAYQGRFCVGANVGAGETTQYFSGSLATAGWHDVALVRSGDKLNLYVDGVKDATTITLSTSFGAANSFVIGARASDKNWGMIGLIDEAAIYTTALSDGVIADHYASAIPEPASLVLLALAGVVVLRRRRA
jgi:hypothetical protein